MSITPDEMVSPEAHRAVCEERDRLRARVAELEPQPFVVGVPIDPATGVRVGNPDGILVTLTEQVAERVRAEARVVELEARVHDLERDRDAAIALARRWRERCTAEMPPDDPVLAALLEQSRRGAVPCGLYLRDWQRLEGVGLVEWRDGAYWATEVSCGG